MLCATIFILVSALLANSLQVDTPPAAVACEPVLIHFGGGSPPYYVSFIPAGQPGSPALKQFPPTNDGQITWNVDLPPGSTLSIMIRDATGNVAYSDKVSVQAGPEKDCDAANAPIPPGANPASQPQPSGTPAASGPAPSNVPASAAPAPAPASQPAATNDSHSATQSGASTKSTVSKNAASVKHKNPVGVLGVIVALTAAFAF